MESELANVYTYTIHTKIGEKYVGVKLIEAKPMTRGDYMSIHIRKFAGSLDGMYLQEHRR